MTSTSRIPQHVAPYVENVPKDSLTLLTSTLSNSVNWLTVRYVCAAFVNDAVKDRPQRETGDGAANSSGDIGVVLVSWMKDWEFWRAEARRSCVSEVDTFIATLCLMKACRALMSLRWHRRRNLSLSTGSARLSQRCKTQRRPHQSKVCNRLCGTSKLDAQRFQRVARRRLQVAHPQPLKQFQKCHLNM